MAELQRLQGACQAPPPSLVELAATCSRWGGCFAVQLLAWFGAECSCCIFDMHLSTDCCSIFVACCLIHQF